jgi:hypothetical protein
MKYFLFPLCLIAFSSCENQTKKESNIFSDDSAGKKLYIIDEHRLGIPAFVFKVTNVNINQYIHPQKGLWLIQSSGAMPEITHTYQVDKNFPVDFSACIEEELPRVDCNAKLLWTKNGCFLQKINPLKDERIWEYTSLDEESKVVVSEAATFVSVTVINTELNARYYFSMIDGKWFLLFVDLRTPCSA